MATIRGLEQNIRCEIESAGIERRKDDRQRTIVAVLAGADGFGSDVSVFIERLIRASDTAAVKDIRIARVYGDVAVFLDAGHAPFPKGNFAQIAAALGGRGAAFLLRAVNPIGKTIVSSDMIKLRGRLVVPTAPGLATVHADDGALVAAESNCLSIIGIDPDALVVVAARRALETHEGFPRVGGFPGGGVGDVNRVGIIRSDGDAHGAGAAAADAMIVVDALPAFASIV